eukprot:TRINITY_DN11671_c0_g2_i1.p1 TRINITY_DN11671_c0_g2~~TRINITY_DN11671_c0_g2_i1.p1  ORF type:complete len:110 (-),score=14.24 TRINITY_DN11671_c0_g2_i1:171-458(-)
MDASAPCAQAGTYTGTYIYECSGGADLDIRSEEKVEVIIKDDGSFELRDKMVIESAQLQATGKLGSSDDKSAVWVKENGKVLCQFCGQEITLTKQ